MHLENLYFRLSDNFIRNQQQPDGTWTSVEWGYGIVSFIGSDTDLSFTACGYLQSGPTWAKLELYAQAKF